MTSIELARIIVGAAAAYAVCGVLFAAWFAAVGVGRLDRAATGSGFWFRLAIAPGAAALWWLFAWRLVASRSEKEAGS